MLTDVIAMIGRAGLSGIFIWAGFGKLMSQGPTTEMLDKMSSPVPTPVLYWGIVVLELLGGLLLLIGFPARIVAFVLAVWCVVTGVLVHLPQGDLPNMINFYKNVAIAGGLLYVVAFGPGVIAPGPHRRRL